jgi:hypothetical protein
MRQTRFRRSMIKVVRSVVAEVDDGDTCVRKELSQCQESSHAELSTPQDRLGGNAVDRVFDNRSLVGIPKSQKLVR